ncbi:helix-turn-helix domain-containing protein [Kitasatospora kifunensis]|uniref:DNA-binding transcriptional ArsR family regulator n=1 Tax=Kitasatospora kifunensis TaxID=58351 RepID=A0A7W7R5S3_KITKI|nr:helix-turn-helix domain-containing protein [Kitasatospora kifunensis]MBB4925759.1 DNA-binding transcriptional ArsR family regulator [Kitasatospora kifunensis]
MSEEGTTSNSAEGLRALAHPLRLRLLSLLTGQAMSAAEAARELGETQANVSYHLRRLLAAGLLEPAEEVVVRGGRAKRYRHDPQSGTTVNATTSGEFQLLTAALTDELRRRSGLRVAGAPGALTDAEFWVDPEVWQRAAQLADELGCLLHEAAQPSGTPGAVRVSATMVLFQMAAQGRTAATDQAVAADETTGDEG